MRFNFFRFNKLGSMSLDKAESALESKVKDILSDQISQYLMTINFAPSASKTFKESMSAKKGFSSYIRYSNLLNDSTDKKGLHYFGELRKGFRQIKNDEWYKNIPEDSQLTKEIKVTSNAEDLIQEFSLTQGIPNGLTQDQKVVCYYCGRQLFQGIFDDRKIQIEHLIPKSTFAQKMTQGVNLLANMPKSKIDLKDSKNQEALSYIKTVIEKNAVNSLLNWALADSQCNACKQDLDVNQYLAYMHTINSADSKNIISKNKKIYEEAKNEGLKNNYIPEALKIAENKKAKSNQILLQTLINAIESSGREFTNIDEFIIKVEDSPRRLAAKFKRLSSKKEVRELFLEEDFNKLLVNFRHINEYSREFRGDKQILFFIKDQVDCPICGIAIKDPSPVNIKSSFQIADVTISASDPQNQLIHSDCIDFIASLSMPALKDLAKITVEFTPTRTAMAKEKLDKITHIVERLDYYMDFIKKQISSYQNLFEYRKTISFNFNRFFKQL